MASVRYKSNKSQVSLTLRQNASIFLRLMADEIVRISEPKTPKKTGRLRADVLRQVLGTSAAISWEKDYAARQEETQFKNYTTAGTGPHFAENAVKQGIGKTQEIAQKAWQL